MEEFYLSNEEIENINNKLTHIHFIKDNIKSVEELGNTIAKKFRELNYKEIKT